MIYEFVSSSGAVIERDYPMAEAPPIGKRIRVKGVVYRRVPVGAVNAIVREERHVAYSLPRAWQDPYIAKNWHKFDDRGHIVCEGKADRLELQAKLKASPDHSHYCWNQGVDTL